AIDVTPWNRTSRRPMVPRARPPRSTAALASTMASPLVSSGSFHGIPAITVINRDLGNCKGSACLEVPQGPALKRLVQHDCCRTGGLARLKLTETVVSV